MSTKRLKEIWETGSTVINGWLTIPSTWTAELASYSGFDSLTIDLQHGLSDYKKAVTMLQVISNAGVVPMVRVPWKEPVSIMRMLDAGAYGIVVPMINNRSDAEQLIEYCKYLPEGQRSYGPIRPNLTHGETYLKNADDDILVLAMIETAEAFDNLDEILATDGLDGIYIGTVDLSISMGFENPGSLENPKLVKAIDQILQHVNKHHLKVGIHAADAGEAVKLSEKGFHIVTPYNDSKVLHNEAKTLVNFIRTS